VSVTLAVKAEILVNVAKLLSDVKFKINYNFDLYRFFKLRYKDDILLHICDVVFKRLTHYRDMLIIVVRNQL
jgi:hypothetical protein